MDKEEIMRLVFIDIDNTLLDFDAYVKQTMQTGFAHFGLKPYEPYMFEVFTEENNRLWHQIEQGTLTFDELHNIRWCNIFHSLHIPFDGIVFEDYFRKAIYDSAIPVDGAYDMLSYLKEKYVLCAASNGPYAQQLHRLEIADMRKYFSYIFVSEKVGVSKPATGFFDYAFQEVNQSENGLSSSHPLTASDAVIIGDSLTSDMEGGLRYGMKTCFYRRNPGIKVPDSIDWVIDNLRDVWKIL